MSWLYGFYFCCFNQRGSFMQNLFGIQNSFLCCFFGCVNGLVKLLARNVERLLISEKGGCDLCSSFTVRKITSWERITKNTLGTHANTSAWRLTKKEIQESQRTKRGEETDSSPGTWPCIVPQVFGPHTCCTPSWLCGSHNCPRWPTLTPGFFVRSLSMAVGEPHPHSQGCPQSNTQHIPGWEEHSLIGYVTVRFSSVLFAAQVL